MYEMIIRIFALIGIIVVVGIPWLLGVVGIFMAITRKLDGDEEDKVDER